MSDINLKTSPLSLHSKVERVFTVHYVPKRILEETCLCVCFLKTIDMHNACHVLMHSACLWHSCTLLVYAIFSTNIENDGWTKMDVTECQFWLHFLVIWYYHMLCFSLNIFQVCYSTIHCTLLFTCQVPHCCKYHQRKLELEGVW